MPTTEEAVTVTQELLDELTDIIQPIHWETWKAALFSNEEEWPDDEEQKFIAGRVDDIAVLEHWDAWGPAIVEKVGKLVVARSTPSSADVLVEALPWQPRIGEEVRATETFLERWPDWRNVPLWVVGMTAHRSTEGLNVTVCDEWPLVSQSPEFTDGFYIGRAKVPDDLATFRETGR